MKNKIIKIVEDKFYKDKPKWKVTFDDNTEWTFFQKENTKHEDYNIKSVGYFLEWEQSNAKYNTARSKEFAIPKKPNLANIGLGGYDSKDGQIARSVVYKGLIDLACAGLISKEEIPSLMDEHTNLILK